MPVLLNVQSSPNLELSASRSMSRVFVGSYLAANPGSRVIDLDLVRDPPSHICPDHLGAFFAPPEFHSPQNVVALQTSEAYLAQVMAADVILIGTPMHNLGIASVLKSWIDNILRIGRTFRYNEHGQAIGLVSNTKRVVLVLASGGVYSSGPMQPFDYASTYVRSVFNFMGVTDITIVRAEGMTMGPERATLGLASAWTAAEAAARRNSARIAVAS